jgi:hypothetical protein
VWRLPRKWFDRLLPKVRAYNEKQSMHPVLIHFVRIPWLIKQGLRHLRFGEFSVITGYSGYILWKTGVLRIWKKLFARKLKISEERLLAMTTPPAAADAT